MGKKGNQLIKGFLLFVIIGARLTMRSFLENIVTYITLFLFLHIFLELLLLSLWRSTFFRRVCPGHRGITLPPSHSEPIHVKSNRSARQPPRGYVPAVVSPRGFLPLPRLKQLIHGMFLVSYLYKKQILPNSALSTLLNHVSQGWSIWDTLQMQFPEPALRFFLFSIWNSAIVSLNRNS